MNDVIDLPQCATKELLRSLARDYHDGQSSQLYAVASSGKFRDGDTLLLEAGQAHKVAVSNGDTLDKVAWLVVIDWLERIMPKEQE